MSDWFATPTGLFALFLLVPLLLLYMLRHRPVKRRVPSTVLWAGVVDAQISTSPFQWLRRSVSLLLMLLALLALTLALAGLRLPDWQRSGEPLTIVLDLTASMAATEQRQTRVELAHEVAAQAIVASASSDVAVLGWDGGLRIFAPAGSTPSIALSALSRAGPAAVGLDEVAVETSLEQLARDRRRLIWISSRQAGNRARVGFLQAGTSQPNAGIVAAGVAEIDANRREAFFGLELFAAEPLRTTFLLERFTPEGVELTDARDFTLEPGRRMNVTIPLSHDGLYRGRLRHDDALALDNEAWVRSVTLPRLAVDVDEQAPDAIHRALKAIEQGTSVISLGGETTLAARVFAGPQAANAQPRLPAVFFGPHAYPPGAAFASVVDSGQTPARPVSGFLWRGTGSPEIVLHRVQPVVAESGTAVLDVDAGPAIALVQRAGETGRELRDLVLGVVPETASGTFQDDPAFVAFWINWFEHIRELLQPLPRGAVSTRDILRVPHVAAESAVLELITPDGSTRRITPGNAEPLRVKGMYRVNGLDCDVPAFGVSLLDATASDLGVRSDHDNDAVLESLRAASRGQQRTSLDLAPWLALLTMLLIVTEWLLFRRRFPHRPQESGVKPAQRSA